MKFLSTCWITQAHTRQVSANKKGEVLMLDTHEREQQTVTRRCKHMPGFPSHGSGICLPGAAKGHQPVFVVDSYAGTVSHICRPDALQLLHPHKKLPLLSECGGDSRCRPPVSMTRVLTSAVMLLLSGVIKPRRPSLRMTAKPSRVTQYSIQQMYAPSNSKDGPPVQHTHARMRHIYFMR